MSTNNPLLTQKSLYLSLSPPLLPDEDPKHDLIRANHPHLPAKAALDVRLTRYLGRKVLGKNILNKLRDNGAFRSIVDLLVTMTGAPIIGLTHPFAAKKFIDLGEKVTHYAYGSHPMQVIHLYETGEHQDCKEFVFFVHGGAWGSGMPWMYRLVASSFLEAGMNVAIVGYRTYPCADVNGQVFDIEQAALFLTENRPDLFSFTSAKKQNTQRTKCYAIGHSSGAHIAFLMIIERIRRKLSLLEHCDPSYFENLSSSSRPMLDFDAFIGLSGPYSISNHFQYEAGRGVEELSPMKPACGYSTGEFDLNSPALRFKQLLTEYDEHITHQIVQYVPRILLLHGIEDTTVPFTATVEAAHTLYSCGLQICDEIYLDGTEHQDTIVHFMLGGKAKDAVLDWLKCDEQQKLGQRSLRIDMRSKI